MRLYTFTNMYLSSIQNGIQTAHIVSELFIRYSDENKPNFHTVREWANDHKTIIVLNGGYSSDIGELRDYFNTDENPFPWAIFNEDIRAIGTSWSDWEGEGALTAAGIILPEEIYEGIKLVREVGSVTLPGLSKWESDLVFHLDNYRSAR